MNVLHKNQNESDIDVHEVQRLLKSLKSDNKFNLIIADFVHKKIRDDIISQIEMLHITSKTIDLSGISGQKTIYTTIKEALKDDEETTVLHLINLELVNESLRKTLFRELNHHRELFASQFPYNTIIWLQERIVNDFITSAPDLWAWRSITVSFLSKQQPSELETLPDNIHISEIDIPYKIDRTRKLLDFLEQETKPQQSLINETIQFIHDTTDYYNQYNFLSDELNDLRKKAIRLSLLHSIPVDQTVFIGRTQEIGKLHDLIEKKSNCIVTGIGGIGKTKLVLEYVHSHKKNFNCVIWLGYSESLSQTMIELNGFFGFKGNTETILKQIQQELAVFDDSNVIILDSFNGSEDELHHFFSDYFPHFRKIVTTRNHYKKQQKQLLELTGLKRESAIHVFNTWYHQDYDLNLLNTVLDITEDHPLLIKLTAKNLDRLKEKNTLDDLLLTFESKHRQAFEQEKTTKTAFIEKERLIDTYITALFNKTDLSEKETKTLRLLAVFSPLSIDESILPDLLGIDQDKISEISTIIQNLVDTGWLERTEQGIRCYPLIKDTVLRDGFPIFEEVKPLIDFLNKSLYCEPCDNPLDKSFWIPFARSLLEHVSEEREEIATLCNNLGIRYRDLGYLENALLFVKKTISILKIILPDNNLGFATPYDNIATIYKQLGNLKKALVFSKKAISIREAVLSDSHPQLATSYNNVSLIYQVLGDLKKALVFSKKAISIREAVLPENHPSLAMSYNNIAMIYQDLGDLENALEFTKKSIFIREAVLPKYHPDLAMSYNNVARIYQDLGNLKNALMFSEKAIAIYEAVLPKNHPDLATSYNNIATIYQDLGDLDNALLFAQKAISIREAVLPKNHTDLAQSYNNVATIYFTLGELEKALSYNIKSVKNLEHSLQPNHFLFKKAYNNLAIIYEALNDTDKAREYRAKAEAIRSGNENDGDSSLRSE